MKISHLIASLAIVACTAFAWFILGGALAYRTETSTMDMRAGVSGVWGPEIHQQHPHAWFETPNAFGGKSDILPSASDIKVDLISDPQKKGLIRHQTYDVKFKAAYTFTNPTKIPQTFYIAFPLPQDTAGLKGFELELDGETNTNTTTPNASGVVIKTILLPASGSTTMKVAYNTRGTDTWKYVFDDTRRISGFQLEMRTDFEEVNYPDGTSSPTDESPLDSNGWFALWNYSDILDAQAIGMDMPKELNAGPVASRIAFFAPVSLLFFVTVILLIGGLKKISIHPMHIFFISAGFFAFHLLFAYLVDLIDIYVSFGIAAVTSVALVCGYLRAVGGDSLFKVALPAQSIYLVFFSASFFIDGLTGITLTVLGIVTLALLMFLTAKTDWKTFFAKNTRSNRKSNTPPHIPAQPTTAS